MRLCDVVRAIAINEDISARDIEDTVMFLTSDTILPNVRVLRRIVTRLNAIMADEDAPV